MKKSKEIIQTILTTLVSAIVATATILTIISLNSCSKNGSGNKVQTPEGWHLVWNDEFL